MPRIATPLFAFVLLATAGLGAGMPKAEDLVILYSPNRTDRASLAPDGRHLAYTVREGTQLKLVLVDVDRPEEKTTLMVGEDARGVLYSTSQVRRAQVDFLSWVNASRLAYAVSVPREETREKNRANAEALEDDIVVVSDYHQELRAVDADGRNDSGLLDDKDLEYAYTRTHFELNSLPEGPTRVGVFEHPVTYGRGLRVVGLLPDKPGFLAFEATATGLFAPTELFKIDVVAGSYERLSDPVSVEGTLLYDRQGQARIEETLATPSKYPRVFNPEETGKAIPDEESGKILNIQYYRYRSPDGKGGWRALDTMFGKDAAMHFHHEGSDYYGPRSFPMAFDSDPNVLYYASNVGTDTVGVYALDVTTGKRTGFAVEVPHRDLMPLGAGFADAALVFDRQHRLAGVRQPGQTPVARWFDADLARVQGELENDFPSRTASILEWDGAKRRFLVLVTGPGDPGRYYVYQTGRPGLLMEFVRCVPELTQGSLDLKELLDSVEDAKMRLANQAAIAALSVSQSSAIGKIATADFSDSQSSQIMTPYYLAEGNSVTVPTHSLNVTEPFAFDTPAGVHLTGCVTLPAQHRGKLPPLLVYCHDFPDSGNVGFEFNRDAEALANSGLMVLQVNYRGTPGFGLKHRDAVREAGFDRAPVEDIRAAVAWVAEHYRFDRKRVALAGEGMGGYVALRALQLYPKEFRCAASIDAPTDLASWVNEATVDLPVFVAGPSLPDPLLPRRRAFFDVGQEKLKAMSVLRNAGQTTQPVFLVQNRLSRVVRVSQATSLHGALKELGREVKYYQTKLDPDNEDDDRDEHQANVMVRVGAFVMDSLYKYRVDIGEAKEEKGP